MLAQRPKVLFQTTQIGRETRDDMIEVHGTAGVNKLACIEHEEEGTLERVIRRNSQVQPKSAFGAEICFSPAWIFDKGKTSKAMEMGK
jgi:hypothetical protein